MIYFPNIFQPTEFPIGLAWFPHIDWNPVFQHPHGEIMHNMYGEEVWLRGGGEWGQTPAVAITAVEFVDGEAWYYIALDAEQHGWISSADSELLTPLY